MKENISIIRSQISKAAKGKGKEPRLVLVSKLKPPSDIMAAYEASQHRAFGENYVDELEAKAAQLPKDIEWHFIGSLQSNKCKKLAAIPNLRVIETLDSRKKADLLEKALAGDDRILRVFLQVNTSGESFKSGLSPLSLSSPNSSDQSEDDLTSVAKHVISSCPHLKLIGLMTIGSWEASHDHSKVNPDFVTLVKSRNRLSQKLGIEPDRLQLSMGMSKDFVQAIEAGSDNVRVGSLAFGKRKSKEEAKLEREREKEQAPT